MKARSKNLTFDGKLYDGTVHAVGSLDLMAKGMPYELALNIDSTDLHKLKMDSPLKMEEIDGKFFLTTLAHGTVADFKNNVACHRFPGHQGRVFSGIQFVQRIVQRSQ